MSSTIMRFRNGSGHEYVEKKDIMHLDACGAYTNIYVRDRKDFFHESHNLNYYCNKLKDNKDFCRIHKGFCVNVKHVAKDIGNTVMMKDGTFLPLARSGRKILKQRFD